MKTGMKITINGKEYASLEEVPSELRHLIEEGINRQLRPGAPSGPVTIRKTFKFNLGHPAPVELQPMTEDPREYRRTAESQQSGNIPTPFPLESLLIPLFCLLIIFGLGLALLGKFHVTNPFFSPAVVLFIVFVVFMGIILLWNRNQIRLIYPILQDIASRIPGTFVVISKGKPVFHVAREGWNGFATFKFATKHNPAFSRLVVRMQPSPVLLYISSKGILDRFKPKHPGTPVETGNREFDSRFGITSSDRNFAIGLMDFSRQPVMERLYSFTNPLVEIFGGQVKIQVGRNLSHVRRVSKRPRDTEALYNFLVDAITIADAASRLIPKS